MSSGRPLALWAGVAAGLRVGQDLSPAEMDRLCQAEVAEDAYQRALRFLSFRTRSEAEIRRYLHRRGVDIDSSERVIDRLRLSQLADDGRFAQTWVENRGAFRPRSRRALTWELRHKGVPAREIEVALEHVDDADMALRAGLRYAYRLRSNPWPDFRRKLYAYLARRGFSSSVIGATVARVWSETTDGLPPLENEELP